MTKQRIAKLEQWSQATGGVKPWVVMVFASCKRFLCRTEGMTVEEVRMGYTLAYKA